MSDLQSLWLFGSSYIAAICWLTKLPQAKTQQPRGSQGWKTGQMEEMKNESQKWLIDSVKALWAYCHGLGPEKFNMRKTIYRVNEESKQSSESEK